MLRGWYVTSGTARKWVVEKRGGNGMVRIKHLYFSHSIDKHQMVKHAYAGGFDMDSIEPRSTHFYWFTKHALSEDAYSSRGAQENTQG